MKQVRRRASRPVPKWASITLLAILAAVAAISVVLALTHLNVDSPNAGEAPGASTLSVPPEPKPEPEPTPEPEPEPAFVSPSMQRLLVASADSGHLIRAQVGTCPTPVGDIQASFDSGTTWENGSLARAEITQILQLDGTEPAIDRMVGLDAECAPATTWSHIGGVDWGVEAGAAGWYLDTADAAVVHTPIGTHTLPCGAVGLASGADRAIVLCADSTVSISNDFGATWSTPSAVPNGSAVGITPATFTVASVGEAECAGVRVRTFDGGTLGEAGACADVSDATGGNLALAGDSTTLYLWAGESFLRSADTGLSWS